MKRLLIAITHPRSLRTTLLWPYVGLTLALALAVGAMSYRASANAVIALTEQVLAETAGRIEVEVGYQLGSAAARLYAAAPLENVPLPIEVGTLAAWRERLWLAAFDADASTTHYVYYGSADGRFVGVERQGQQGEWRLTLPAQKPREISRFNDPFGAFTDTVTEQGIFDPRERVWYQSAVQAAQGRAPGDKAPLVWSPIHNNFRDGLLSVARSRALLDASGQVLGVVSTDMSLSAFSDFVAALKPSPNGLAMVAQADGLVVAASMGRYTQADAQGNVMRVRADQSEVPLIRAAWAAWQAHRAAVPPALALGPPTASVAFEHAGQTHRAAVRLLSHRRGDTMPDWTTFVVIPDADQLGAIKRTGWITAGLGSLAALLILLLGSQVVGSVVRAIRNLQSAAQRMGHGELNVPLPQSRRDEIGQLARTLDAMQTELSTDRLTGLTSRTALQRQLAFAIEQQRRRSASWPVAPPQPTAEADPNSPPAAAQTAPARQFALLFLDLNGFKAINDQLGHDVGDAVLAEVGLRLKRVVRPGDVVARLGGDEFVMVLWRLSADAAVQRVIQTIHAALAEPLDSVRTRPGSADLRVGTAVGAAFYPEDGEDTDSLIKVADARMYAHKGDRGR